MRAVTDVPRPVRELPHVWIPISDGVRLAARIWLPEDAEEDPVPAVLELIPYRKSDWTWPRDAPMHPYVAGHGYACARVDLRGSGDSEGILEDEYLPREQDDAEEVIAWLAAQSWCTGAVGMTGISWGGFNALQVAARRPAALQAIVTVGSTDDRYADDVHYRGGCLLGIDMLPWGTAMLVWNAVPPDPDNVGEGWRDVWLDRLERTPPFVETWLAHQRRDEYWQQGSVCEDFSAIACPVLAVGGFADAYSNPVFRLVEGLTCQRWGILGPWAHAWPHDALPGPSIGFLQECVRWWDRWLKGLDTGVERDPLLRAWMHEWSPPAAYLPERAGRWVAEDAWPSPRIEPMELALGRGTLGHEAGPELPLVHASPQATGLDSGLAGAYGDAVDLPPDQRLDDGLSLTFDTEPLGERLEILGFPEARLALSVDRPLALVAVRLCDVAPDGASALVTRTVLNLAHRNGHAVPEPLEPGRRIEVGVELDGIGYAFAEGHRIRLAVSTCYWPFAWPSPEPVTITLFAGTSRLVLPVRPLAAADSGLRPFAEPEGAPPLPVEVLAPGRVSRVVRRDVAASRSVLDYETTGGRYRLPNGTELADGTRELFTIVEGDPLSAEVETRAFVDYAKGAVRTRVETHSSMRSDAASFEVVNALAAFEGGERVFARTWTRRVPRDHV